MSLSVVLSVAIAQWGCGAGSSSTRTGEAAQTGTPVVTLSPEIGQETRATLSVSGELRTAMPLPAPNASRSSQCGTTGFSVNSLNGQNFAYIEVKNPGDSAAAVSIGVDGPSPSSLSLFAYASSTPPSRDNVNQCLVSDEGHFATASMPEMAPSLSKKNGKALVIAAHASAFVLLATNSETGDFTVTARTESLAAVPDTPAITIPTVPNGETSATVLVSGTLRTAMPLPAPNASRSSQCGTTGFSVNSLNGQNFAYIEVKNPGDSAAAVSIGVDGPSPSSLSLFAYASSTPPSRDNVNQCLVSDEGHFATASMPEMAPSLSKKNGKALVIAAHASAFVLLATNSETGDFTVKAQLQ